MNLGKNWFNLRLQNLSIQTKHSPLQNSQPWVLKCPLTEQFTLRSVQRSVVLCMKGYLEELYIFLRALGSTKFWTLGRRYSCKFSTSLLLIILSFFCLFCKNFSQQKIGRQTESRSSFSSIKSPNSLIMILSASLFLGKKQDITILSLAELEKEEGKSFTEWQTSSPVIWPSKHKFWSLNHYITVDRSFAKTWPYCSSGFIFVWHVA